jgi:EAL domain-containing protein (putative c-di-GMP-specific phosphodiesterase class I)
VLVSSFERSASIAECLLSEPAIVVILAAMYLSSSGRPTVDGERDTRDTRDEAPPELVLQQLVSYVQPIVSVRQREVRLVEGLVRSCDRQGRVRMPAELFADAIRRGYRTELETGARRAAFDAYQCVLVNSTSERPPVLSLNTDASLIVGGARGAEQLAAEVHERGLVPNTVALEILESALSNVAQLEEFCRTARRLGFLLALDDVGMGYSNLARIPRLEPDILKIDRELVHGMSLSYHRREVFRSLLSLAHQIGALVIAEGIEDESDVRVGLTLGCDLFQGFYFGRPIDARAGEALHDASRLREAGDDFRASATRRLNDRRARQRRSEQAARILVGQLKSVGQASFDGLLRQALARMPYAEALYVLDDHGIQITDTAHRVASSRQTLFQPADRGADQSLKPYFLMLQSGLERYTSEPYVSSASGNFCITMSRMFNNVLDQSYVLCCDLNVPKEA